MTTIMATIAGVRDLKRDAPRLVRRASKGERIVITRYGKPQAELGPIKEARGADRGRGRTVQWEAERTAFERLRRRLAKRYRGRWVAIYRARVVGVDRDHHRLFERVWRLLGGETFFIGRLGGPPPLVDMPGFEAE